MHAKMTAEKLLKRKREGKKITALTAYDYPFAKMVDEAGVDIILVGDSLGMVFRGEDNTLKVTVEEMAYHTRAVRKGVNNAMLIADMPFLSCHLGVEEAVRAAGSLISEGAEAVKVEGASGIIDVVKRLVEAGIPVMGHIGLTPQSIHKLGGYKIQGKRSEGARKIISDADLLEKAGAFATVLECVPEDLASIITGKLKIPVIGIGAGPHCDGQILVTHDLLGMSADFAPKFVKKYADLNQVAHDALAKYIEETESGLFPDEEHSYASPKRLKAI
ncbi:3-methyl-2-oxobutanoate hydroxymethyltransferase [hydrothermal vent metagenome]|uniref:3-methyl-2-oxobutanoate hydroxymethyltransferase n=1 Tax=hydrothermal vent metagenome TaxID=652676 RepID=A0A3B1C7Q7_9ZZZZ